MSLLVLFIGWVVAMKPAFSTAGIYCIAWTVGICGLSGLSPVPLAAQTQPNAEDEAAKKHDAAARKLISLQVQQFKVYSISKDKERQELKRESDSRLHWTNSVLGDVYGDVFIWTADGKPAAIASLFQFFSPIENFGAEFQSLSGGTIEATFAGHTVWKPAGPGVRFHRIPQAPSPLATKSARGRQLRGLARQFTADCVDRNDDANVRPLRLLAQPIFRYDSRDPNVLDGAVFVLAHGTDPELLLLIEARKADTGFRWEYAVGRQNSIQQRLMHEGQTVWEGPKLAPPWGNVHKAEKSYMLLLSHQMKALQSRDQ